MAGSALYTVGDTGKDFTVVCLDDTTPANLNGATSVIARISRPQNTAPIIRAATVTDAGTGKVTFDWVTGDLSVAGYYHVKFQVTYGSGEVQSYPAAEGGIQFTVSKQIGA